MEMTQGQQLRERMNAGKVCVGTGLSFSDPAVAELNNQFGSARKKMDEASSAATRYAGRATRIPLPTPSSVARWVVVSSPCTPAHLLLQRINVCLELVGADEMDCGPTSTETTTWGRLKDQYRDGQ